MLKKFVRDIFRDGYDAHSFRTLVSSYVRQGDERILEVVRDRLLFLALTRKSINCFFNPRDGRRLTLRDLPAVVENDSEEDSRGDEDEIGEEHHKDDDGLPALAKECKEAENLRGGSGHIGLAKSRWC